MTSTRSQCWFFPALKDAQSQNDDMYVSPIPLDGIFGFRAMSRYGCNVLQALSIVSHHNAIRTELSVGMIANGKNDAA